MTENKQFKIVNDCGDYHLLDGDEQLGYDLCSYSMRKANWNNVVDKLNEQSDKITEQAIQIDFLKDENKHMKQVLEENKQLKERLEYIQSSITEAINHSKTELEQKALKKVIEDYNEYMLGHKEVSE